VWLIETVVRRELSRDRHRSIILIWNKLASKQIWPFSPEAAYIESQVVAPMTLLAYHKKPVESEMTAEAFERHYSVIELAEMWSLSERTIRRMFDGEVGVVNWGHAGIRRKRGYQTLRIPESVMLRVYRRIRKAS
jgi:hypothetical protein